jgi:hypothetical protein
MTRVSHSMRIYESVTIRNTLVVLMHSEGPDKQFDRSFSNWPAVNFPGCDRRSFTMQTLIGYVITNQYARSQREQHSRKTGQQEMRVVLTRKGFGS